MTRSVCVAVALVTLLNVVGAMHSINRVLMPLSLKKKLCEQNPDLKICLKETGLKKRVGYFEYSFWDVCDSRPYIPLCRLRPAKEPKGGVKEVKMEEYHPAIEGSGLEIDSETTSPEQPTFTDSTNLQPNYL